MKFGVFYEIQLPTPHDEGAEQRAFREALEHVELADRLGIQHMWGVEHHFLDDHALSSAPEVWLAAAAARTRQIRIGHGIVCMPPGFNHPAHVAERIATLDHISGGRVEFGTGESSSRMELEGFGVDAPSKRRAYLEALEQTCNMMAMTPYPGFQGEFFSMPCRNIVPKPYQRPHPPLWVAGKPDVAASHGMGCLGFNVVGGTQARIMVDQYYRTIAEDCVPIGHAVNANIAVMAMMHCDTDQARAEEHGEHLKFFGYTIGKYYLDGKVVPGRGDAWGDFMALKDTYPHMGDSPTNAIGTPDHIRRHIRALQDAGVDQVLLMHQAGRLDHERNCRSLELFAREVMPEFVEKEDLRERQKAERLAPFVEKALARKKHLPMPAELPVVEPYGRFSHFATEKDHELERSGTSSATAGALGLRQSA
ncbi:LLM class flavin-dependent oxidoreductase [Zavarzinia sp. CC-PAN008]|uniref:LLM class flavin-dependent oxidoreductase n=1 Tax=Zavarzinia sp. CC-PAN008 TaxID=3243332 RepID=UPI003F74762C